MSQVAYKQIQVNSPAPTGVSPLMLENDLKILIDLINSPAHTSTSNPGSTDDLVNSGGHGYFGLGAKWWNSSTQTMWICTSGTTNAAVWEKLLIHLSQDSAPTLGAAMDAGGFNIVNVATLGATTAALGVINEPGVNTLVVDSHNRTLSNSSSVVTVNFGTGIVFDSAGGKRAFWDTAGFHVWSISNAVSIADFNEDGSTVLAGGQCVIAVDGTFTLSTVGFSIDTFGNVAIQGSFQATSGGRVLDVNAGTLSKAGRIALKWDDSGSATTLSFYSATPVVQPSHINDATTGVSGAASLATLITAYNDLATKFNSLKNNVCQATGLMG